MTVSQRGRKRKGDDFERRVAKRLDDAGFSGARKQPLSGALLSFPHDVRFIYKNKEYIVECKKHKDCLISIKKWLGSADMLVHERDYEREPLVTLRWSVLMELLEDGL